MRKVTRTLSWAVVGSAMFISGCAFTSTSDISNPFVRKASWFSFLNADDLRTACSAGEPGSDGRIRLVYNADYYDEVRSYDIVPQPQSDNTRFDLTSRIFGPAEISNINVEVNAPLGAFGGELATRVLDRDSYLELTDALQADGFGTQQRDGLRLYAADHYWIAIGCSGGYVTLAAWTSDKDDLRDLTFPSIVNRLSGLDGDLPKAPDPNAPKYPDPIYSGNDHGADSRNFYRTVRGNMLR
ncbi:hypothetical protein LPB41_27930 [Thalassospira sp. MA62]|nr:hypothetical protein [Thalassospira sp. MA62]